MVKKCSIHCPIKKKYISPKDSIEPWIPQNIKIEIKKPLSCMQLFKRNQITRTVYNSFRNYVTNKIRKSKKHYYETAFDQVRHDTRKTWKIINNIFQ